MTPDQFAQRLTVLYGPPDTHDPKAYIEEYLDPIKKVDPTVLKRAGDIIRDTHRRRSWPVPADVLEAVRQAGSALQAERPKPAANEEIKWSHEDISIANRVIRSPLGMKAADEGWIRQLWDFARSTHRAPNGYEMANLIASSKEHLELVDWLKQNPSNVNGALLRLAKSMRERGERLAEISMGTRTSLDDQPTTGLTERSKRITGERDDA